MPPPIYFKSESMYPKSKWYSSNLGLHYRLQCHCYHILVTTIIVTVLSHKQYSAALTTFARFILTVLLITTMNNYHVTVSTRHVATCKLGKPRLTSFSETLALFFIQFVSFWKMKVVRTDKMVPWVYQKKVAGYTPVNTTIAIRPRAYIS